MHARILSVPMTNETKKKIATAALALQFAALGFLAGHVDGKRNGHATAAIAIDGLKDCNAATRMLAKQRDDAQANTDTAVKVATTLQSLDERCIVAAEKLVRMLDACEARR